MNPELLSIAFYGGAFNPVHLAHVQLAQQCQAYFDFSKFYILPSARPAYKQPLAAARYRVAMLQLAFDQRTEFVIDQRELERAGSTRTIDTLRELRAELGEQQPIFFIIGSDSWLSFDTWESWTELLERANWIIVDRPEYLWDETQQDAHSVLRKEYNARLTTNKQAFLTCAAGKIFKFTMPLMNISSTHIRQQIQRGATTEGMLPVAVRHYIDHHSLYL